MSHSGETAQASAIAVDGTTPAALDADGRRELLTVLTAEHSNLQAARSADVVEANGRTTAFLAALSGSLVALALAAQVESLGETLGLIALVVAATILYAGLVTFLRLVQLAQLDSRLVIGINRIRHSYLEMVPSLAAVEVLSPYDDLAGILGEAGLTGRTVSRVDVLAAAPAMIAGLNGILAAVIAGLVAAELGFSSSASVTAGFVAGVVLDVALLVYGLRAGARFWRAHPPRHPTPRG
jgi:hypothetical protein